MTKIEPHPARSTHEAVIFDLDGVVTDTASVHALAWKALFDEELPRLSAVLRPGTSVPPFDVGVDYRRSVDGRPREDGIRAFLASRGLEPGEPEIAALAARKQAIFERLLDSGVRAFPGTVALLHRLRARGTPLAVVTSSRNGTAVLAAAGLAGVFDVIVTGADAARLGLPGKPDPAMFLEAARLLRIPPGRTVVIEDAEAGVRAASHGGFGLVIGIDRTGYGDRLRAEGADLVISDLGELDLRDLELAEPNPNDIPNDASGGIPDPPEGAAPALPRWAGGESGSDPWLLRYVGFDPATEGLRRPSARSATATGDPAAPRRRRPQTPCIYPGTYLAGVYNRVRTDLGGRTVEDEHLVNGPNWLPLWFRVADNDWFDPGGPGLVDYLQELDLRRGVLRRVIRFRDEAGRTTRVTSDRFVSQSAPHVAVLTTTFEAEDWSGPITVRSALDGRVENRNVAADRLLTGTHLIPRTARESDDETLLLEVETNQSGIHIALAAGTRAHLDRRRIPLAPRLLRDDAGWVAHEFELDLSPAHPVTVEKTVVVGTSRDRAIASPARAVTSWLRRLPEPERLRSAHARGVADPLGRVRRSLAGE